MTEDVQTLVSPAIGEKADTNARRLLLMLAACAGFLALMYAEPFEKMVGNWDDPDSYYSHGFLIPPIVLYLLWLKRKEFLAAPQSSHPLGYLLVGGACAMLLLSDFLAFVIGAQLSFLPMVFGLSLLLFGWQRTKIIWFPLFFLIMMIPLPGSVTQAFSLRLKLFASEVAVQMAHGIGYSIIRDGSYIYFKDDLLLVGDVCGGLRSLIALLAIGLLMAYFSKTPTWARVVILLMAVPIAIIANIFRIFTLCLVAYYHGSTFAAGTFHDISGILIFVVAFILFFSLESLLRWISVRRSDPAGAASISARTRGDSDDPPPAPAGGPGPIVRYLAVGAVLLGTTGLHLSILDAREEAADKRPPVGLLDLPERIGPYEQIGDDIEVAPRVREILQTSLILMRNYKTPQGWPIQLQIVYTGASRRSLHFPEYCLVGAGYEILEQYSAPVGFDFNAKRLVLGKGSEEQAVLYWFKTDENFTGNFFLNSWYWAKNQITFGAPTSSMIKLSTTMGGRDEEAIFAMLEDFALKLKPILLEKVH